MILMIVVSLFINHLGFHYNGFLIIYHPGFLIINNPGFLIINNLGFLINHLGLLIDVFIDHQQVA